VRSFFLLFPSQLQFLSCFLSDPHTHIHTHTHTHTHTYTHTHTHKRIYTHTHTYTRTHTCIYIYSNIVYTLAHTTAAMPEVVSAVQGLKQGVQVTHTHTHTHTNTHTHTHTQARRDIRTHTYTYTHTHTRTLAMTHTHTHTHTRTHFQVYSFDCATRQDSWCQNVHVVPPALDLLHFNQVRNYAKSHPSKRHNF
jgi:hypothetical protein